MILHTINKTSAFTKCTDLIDAGDTVVLLEDGVYLALLEKSGQQSVTWLALLADIEARGLVDRLPDHVKCISYLDFVNATTEAEKVCAWF